jgi:hypothetical protein
MPDYSGLKKKEEFSTDCVDIECPTNGFIECALNAAANLFFIGIRRGLYG